MTSKEGTAELQESVLSLLKNEAAGLSVPDLVVRLEKEDRKHKIDDIQVRQVIWNLISKGRLNLSEDWRISFAK